MQPGFAAHAGVTPVLRPPTRVGVTGHSDLTASSMPIVEAVMREWLIAHTSPPWVGVSCLASGADQVFAGLVLGLGGQLEVVLPARDYRARKVDADRAGEFDRYLAAAVAVTVLDFDRSSRQAYMAASTALLAVVEMVIAVWDGLPARRHGSTGDVVAEAPRLGLTTSILWPVGAARRPSQLSRPGGTPTTGITAQGPRLPADVARILDGLVFPAQRWEIVMWAEHSGADCYTAVSFRAYRTAATGTWVP
jgi:hypothetical protein